MPEGLLQERPLVITTGLQGKSDDIGKDRLQFLPYARALTKFIQTCDTPMTVGLQGDWGTGKTSMLNMLRGDDSERSGLLMATRCLVVNFETWSYSQFNDRASLPTACLFALTEKLGEALSTARGVNKQSKQRSKEALSQASNRLKRVIGGIKLGVPGINVDLKNLVEGEEPKAHDLSLQMIEFKKKFQELVEIWANDPEGKKRVVICVDDLDRIEPVIALEMLEAIKNFLDVKGCVFVLAVDYEVVQSGMAKKLGVDIQKSSGKSFFDKIIQLPFNMPESSYKLEDYVHALIGATGLPNVDGLDPKFLAEITRASVGSNPRSIKRVMNYTRLIEYIRDENKGERFTQDESHVLYSMICMQIAWPELFAHFMADPTSETIRNLENWDYLESVPELKPMFERAPNPEKVKNDISTFFDTLFERLDKDGDGQIGEAEFKPVRKVLQMAKFTSVEIKVRPRDQFVSDVRSKCKGSQDTTSFLDKIFLLSELYLNTEIKYRPAGKRYVTLVHNRRQLGSLVTLKSKPLVIRLNVNPEMLKLKVREFLPDQDQGDLENLVTGLGPEDSSLTGYGDTIVRFENLSLDTAADSPRLLNAVITAAMAVLDEGGLHKRKAEPLQG